jgi:hypothetical protein
MIILLYLLGYQEINNMKFVIRGLSANHYRHLYGMSTEELEANGAKRYVCDAAPGYPDRIEMRDAEIGETLLLVNHVSMDKQTPYKASHAIFVREGAEQSFEAENEVPPVMFSRLLSLRAFDQSGMMVDANVAKAEKIQTTIEKMFRDKQVAHIDAHNAVRGCFSGRITRA